MRASKHRHSGRYLAAVAFAESSFFPIPPDAMIIPMVIAQPRNWVRIALISTVFSVLGGLAGYFIGMFLFETIGQLLINLYSYQEKLPYFNDMYKEWGGWVVFAAGLTPFPYKVVTIASGIAKLNLVIFLASSVLARGIRFFLVAGLIYYFGDSCRILLERYLGIITITLVAILLFLYIGLDFVLK